MVNDDDVTIVGANYAPGISKPKWAFGDFDYNGFVNDDDVTLLGAFYNPSAEPLILQSAAPNAVDSAVPEPAAIVLFGAAVFCLASSVLPRRRLMGRLAFIMLAGASLVLFASDTARADIFRWDNGKLIPGTEGLTPAPGIVLDDLDLSFARLSSSNLESASLQNSILERASLYVARLSNANLTHADFTGADLERAQIEGADLSGATIVGATFEQTGLTKQQFYSTASYNKRDLHGISLKLNNLSGWDFTGQDLERASFAETNLSNAMFAGGNLTDTDFSHANLNGVVFVGAVKQRQSFASNAQQR